MWFNELQHDSITTWRDLKEAFLEWFFPQSKKLQLRAKINKFRKLPTEALHEIWLRLNKKLKKSPNHKLIDDHLMETFYRSLNMETKLIVDIVVRGSFMDKTYTNTTTKLDRVRKTNMA